MQLPIVVIPCKLLNESKSRLSGVLSAAARRELSIHLLDRTIQAAKLVTAPRRVFLVTADVVAAARARPQNISVISDSSALNEALTNARHLINRREALDGTLIILPIDLVGVSEIALRNCITMSDVTIVPDGPRDGTNLLVLKRDAVREFPFRFGANSFFHHCRAAQDLNCSISILDDSVLGFDLDSADDYSRAHKLGYLNTLETAL